MKGHYAASGQSALLIHLPLDFFFSADWIVFVMELGRGFNREFQRGTAVTANRQVSSYFSSQKSVVPLLHLGDIFVRH